MKPSRMPLAAIVVSAAVAMAPVTALAEPAVHYYPGTDVVLVTVTETVTATTTVEDTGTEFKLNRNTTTKREGTVAVRTVADTANPRTIDLQAKGLTDSAFSVELSEDGLLRAINLSSTGRFGDFLTSAAKIAGVVLAVASLATATPPAGACNGRDPMFAAMPVNARYFVTLDATGCTLAKQVVADQKTVQQRENELRGFEDQVVGAPSGEVATLQRRVTLARASLEDALKLLASHSQSFAAALKAFEADQELGTVPKGQSTQTAVLHVADLPPTDILPDGVSFQDALGALNKYPAAKDVLNRLKVAVTLQALQGAGQATPSDSSKGGGKDGDDRKSVTVCYRQSIPAELRVLLLKSTVVEDNDGSAGGSSPTPAKLREVSHTIENVLQPSAAVICPAFKASAFADRKLALVFDAKGRPQKIQREEKSSAAAAAGALAAASSTLLSDAAANLKTLEGIQVSRRALSLSDLTARAERLKQEKAVLDAQLQLQGAQATFDSALKQQQLQADLNALNVDVQLTAAEDTREQRLEIERLKLAIDQLHKSLELLKAQQELEKTRK
jgi:hypothetical protein